jgi:hypothetical protein
MKFRGTEMEPEQVGSIAAYEIIHSGKYPFLFAAHKRRVIAGSDDCVACRKEIGLADLRSDPAGQGL